MPPPHCRTGARGGWTPAAAERGVLALQARPGCPPTPHTCLLEPGPRAPAGEELPACQCLPCEECACSGGLPETPAPASAAQDVRPVGRAGLLRA